jgi:outer membrane protein OmpA-like peptidoglycan-associated protein
MLLLALLPLPAAAQVSTNDSALQALKPAMPPPAAAQSQPAPAAPGHPRRVSRHNTTPSHPARPARLPAVPAAPPPNPVIVPPPPVLPTHAPQLPPAIKPNANAHTTVAPIRNGSRLVFDPGSADLNQPSLDALHAIAAAAKADPAIEVSVTAWAPGVAEDPSSPHRLSLDRALAARAALINDGLASERIHAIAKGFNDIAGGPPDRMDVVAAHPASTPAGTPHP